LLLTSSTKLMATGIVAALIASASILALMPFALESLQERKPGIQAKGAETDGMMDLRVKVVSDPEPSDRNHAGIEVRVFSAEDGESVVVRKVAESVTDLNGTAQFELTRGNYVISAWGQGHQGFVKIDLVADQDVVITLQSEEVWKVMTPLI
jgi:hypothetical protein